VTDVAAPLANVMASDKLFTAVQNMHGQAIQEVVGGVGATRKNKGKETFEDEDTVALRGGIEETSLKMWPYVVLFLIYSIILSC